MIHVLSLSGGKDSTAGLCWAIRTGLAPRINLAADTGWEADFPGHRWAEYIEALRVATREPIRVCAASPQFKERVLQHGMFPGKLKRGRWCTEELKLDPFAAELDRIREQTGDEVTVVIFVRAEESADRAVMPEREYSDFYDCEVWRPALNWSLADVIAEHHRAHVPLNPLYLLGAERVGCWPCVKSGKDEIALIARHNPERIDDIAELEKASGNRMFTLEEPTVNGVRGKCIPTPIHEVVAWARTSRGGRKLMLFPEPSGCARWGICEPASQR